MHEHMGCTSKAQYRKNSTLLTGFSPSSLMPFDPVSTLAAEGSSNCKPVHAFPCLKFFFIHCFLCGIKSNLSMGYRATHYLVLGNNTSYISPGNQYFNEPVFLKWVMLFHLCPHICGLCQELLSSHFLLD